MTVVIRQPSMYFDYAFPDWVDPGGYTLVQCDCGNLCEKGVGLCEPCIERESIEAERGLEEILNAITVVYS